MPSRAPGVARDAFLPCRAKAIHQPMPARKAGGRRRNGLVACQRMMCRGPGALSAPVTRARAAPCGRVSRWVDLTRILERQRRALPRILEALDNHLPAGFQNAVPIVVSLDEIEVAMTDQSKDTNWRQRKAFRRTAWALTIAERDLARVQDRTRVVDGQDNPLPADFRHCL